MKYKEYKPHSSSFFAMSANLVAMLVLLMAPFLNVVGLIVIILALVLEKNSGLVKECARFALVLWLIESIFMFVMRIFTGGFGLAFDSFTLISSLTLGFAGLIYILYTVFTLAILGFSIWLAVQAYRWKVLEISWFEKLPFWQYFQNAQYTGEGEVPEECASRYKK